MIIIYSIKLINNEYVIVNSKKEVVGSYKTFAEAEGAAEILFN